MTLHMRRNIVLLVLLACAFLYGTAAHGDTVYNESVSGDLSNNGLAPTVLTVSQGSNDVYGTTGKSAAGVIDRDYFTFTVPEGMELTAITVLPGTTTLGPDGESFIGIESGPASDHLDSRYHCRRTSRLGQALQHRRYQRRHPADDGDGCGRHGFHRLATVGTVLVLGAGSKRGLSQLRVRFHDCDTRTCLLDDDAHRPGGACGQNRPSSRTDPAYTAESQRTRIVQAEALLPLYLT